MIKLLFYKIATNQKEIGVYPATVGLAVSGLIIVVITLFIQGHVQDNPAYLHNDKGSSLITQGLNLDAIKELNKAIEFDPNLTEAYLNLGHAYSQIGRYQKAIESYDKGIDLNPTIALAYDNRGAAHHNLGQILLAIYDYDKALELDPTLSKVYFNRSIAYSQLGRHEESDADKTKACAQNKDLCWC